MFLYVLYLGYEYVKQYSTIVSTVHLIPFQINNNAENDSEKVLLYIL